MSHFLLTSSSSCMISAASATSGWHGCANGHHDWRWPQDWEIVPSALDLDPRLQHLLDRHNMSSEETVLPDRPEVQEKGNPPSSLPGQYNTMRYYPILFPLVSS